MPMRAFRFSTFTLDVGNACLEREGSRLPLSPKDFALLHHLVAHRGRLVPHAELLAAVWTGTAVGPDVLKVRVARLRRLLGDDAIAPRFIASVHGEGYRFVAPVIGTPFGALERPPASRGAPLIGREAELEGLLSLLAEAASGQRRIAFVSGEPGIGKTALIDAFAERAMASGPAVWIGRGQCNDHHGSGEPYLPVLEALARLARSNAHEALASVLRQYAPSWLADLPALLDGPEAEALKLQTPGLTRERRLRELAEALETLGTAPFAGGDPHPPLLLLVLEDLHWADPSTVDLLTMLARRPDRARLMVVGSHRSLAPELPLRAILPDLRAHSVISEITLPPLLETDVARYLDARFRPNAFSSQLAAPLHRRTEGNPLFFTDVVRDLLARELIIRTDTGWSFRGDIEAVRHLMPASFRRLVEKQCDEASPVEQRLLEAARSNWS